MTTVTARSRLFDLFAFHRRSSVEQQNTAARLPNLRTGWLSLVLCFGAIAIGIIALTGYVLGNASIAALSAHGKPVAAVTALAFIVLGAGLLALRSPAPAGLLTARRAALGVVVLAAADLLSAALSSNIEVWQVWAARGGVYLHPFPVTAILILALGSALFFVTTRRDFAGHLIASTVLLICALFLFAYALKVPAFLDPFRRVAPVLAATFGLALISIAELLERPRGWVVPLLSRTSTGVMTRVLLLAILMVPFLADVLRDLIAGMRWLDSGVGHAAVVDVVEVFFSAAIVLGVGVILHKRESDRARLASIVESSVDAIIGKSSEGLIESWNGGAERLYGYTAAEAIGRSIAMLAPPELHDEIPLLLERLRRGERIEPFETVRVAKDGRRINVWLSVSPVLDHEGNVAGASTIAHDITDRKRAEAGLRESEDKFFKVFHSNPAMIALVTLDGTFSDLNQSYAVFLGYSREEMLGKSVTDLQIISVEERQRMVELVQRAGGSLRNVEVSFRARDGRLLDVLLSSDSFSLGGVPHRLTTLVNTTERKHAEEALQLAHERLQTLSHRLLEVQETERHQVARELHDEIGQALTAIKINLQTLRQFSDLATDASRLDESTGIVDRALGQVRTLSLELRPPLLDDLGPAAALRWLTDQHARRTGLSVVFRSSAVDARFDAAVETVCFRVAQEALNNVVRHARARHVTVELQAQEDGLHLRVSDDGVGFDVPSAHRRAAQGASLGLLGMEERATLVGGGIEWRSAPGRGAEVHAWFPLPRPAGNNDEAATAA